MARRYSGEARLRSRIGRLVLAAALICGPSTAFGQIDDDVIESARDSVREVFDPARAGIFYAASINFAVQPDISTARFSRDGLEDSGIGKPRLENTRLPLRHTFALGSDDLQGFLQGTIGYQDLSMQIPLPDDVVAVDWRSRGIDLGAGVEYRLSDEWALLPSLNVGVADLGNKADYGESALGDLFRPVFAGIVFDWDARAWIAGAALAARYERDLGGFRLRANVSASANRIRSFDESSPDIGFDDVASTLDLAVNTIHPLGRLKNTPVSLVTILGATSFVGDARGELGFDEFAEFGLALQFDLRDSKLVVDDFRIGLKAIAGPEVSGWSIVIGRGL